MVTRDERRRLAAAATPGPWIAEEVNSPGFGPKVAVQLKSVTNPQEHPYVVREPDGAHIAANSPDVIIAEINLIEELFDTLEWVVEAIDQYTGETLPAPGQPIPISAPTLPAVQTAALAILEREGRGSTITKGVAAMPYGDGKRFKCLCGVNVFTVVRQNVYRCNGCFREYEGIPVKNER